MKNIQSASILAIGAVSALLLAGAMTAQAATTYGTTGTVGATVNAVTNTSAPANTTGTSVNANVGSSVTTGQTSSSSGAIQTTATMNTTNSGATDMGNGSSTNTSVTTDMNTGVMLNLGQSNVQSTNAAMVSANTVSSDDTLTAYAQGQLYSDPNITNVSATDNSVSVQYTEPVKFLGFIPARETATATVNADGSVNVHYPWYGFLSAKNADSIRTDIQSRTTSLVEANGSANATLSAQTKAQLLDNVISVLKNYGGSTASANTTTNTTTSANTPTSGY